MKRLIIILVVSVLILTIGVFVNYGQRIESQTNVGFIAPVLYFSPQSMDVFLVDEGNGMVYLFIPKKGGWYNISDKIDSLL